MTQALAHRWRFFRAGGFDQVQLETPADLAALRGLDQKLWASLACPVNNLELDRRMLQYIDQNNDGRIRAPEMLDVVDWTLARLADPAALFHDGPLQLSSLTDDAVGARLRLAAQRLLGVLGRPDGESLTPADTADLAKLFPPQQANGDGLVPATFTDDTELKAAIADIIACLGAQTDRSGEPAVGAEQIAAFFDQARQLHAWHARAAEQGLDAFGEGTVAAVEALSAVRAKIDDYFTRVAMAEFDPRAAALMNAREEELVRLASLSLADASEVADLPLATVQHGEELPLSKSLNPAWQPAIDAFRQRVVVPVYGEQDSLSREQWQHLVALCGNYLAWRAETPNVAIAEVLERGRILELVEQGAEARLLALVEKDKTVAEAADGLVELDKLIRLRHGLVTLLRNFVSFQAFYSRQEKAVFQAGVLYIDGKSCELVVEVDNVEAHAKVAAASDCFLLYCACTRRGEPVRGKETLNIVVAVTAGGEGDLQAGRHGLFYDREGNDWDATVVKVVQHAISIREAFWSPYRRVSKLVSDQVQKLAASRDADMVSKTAAKVGETGAAVTPTPAFDIAKFAGIFAAIGLAVGALGTALAAVVTGILSLALWQVPLLLFCVLLAISGPAMLLAWFKLRRRSLGPILDGNGWAVNAQARISIPFGTALTQMAELPKGSDRALRDPYANKSLVWPWILALLLALGVGYYAWNNGVFSPEPEVPAEAAAPVDAAAQ
ncbi:hypothetical protein H3221_001595 [Pseudomonas sp. LMG 31766]|uniref:EF-hand domain-containing protein n=1 Tax=Pseudomonas chaetocerotis TaxID=2758695 RepID=A0A931D1K5_9PSED|nr:hypothetical protein [Pseudomonas chaetocerotis]MBZ9663438.1 hypothetical protein [Pseudomonas chaetocerotis]